MKVNGLIWDDWNKKHILRHGVMTDDVEEICHGKHGISESFRGRILVFGKHKSGKTLKIVLSDKDRDGKFYDKDVYYAITAYFEEVTND